MHPMDWYSNEQKKRKERQEAQDVSLINRALQRILHQIEPQVQKEDYQKEAREAEKCLSHSGIWHISYANNMENPKVALEQALFIRKILAKEDIDHKRRLGDEVDIQMRRLGNVDWGMYGEYNRRVHMIGR